MDITQHQLERIDLVEWSARRSREEVVAMLRSIADDIEDWTLQASTQRTHLSSAQLLPTRSPDQPHEARLGLVTRCCVSRGGCLKHGTVFLTAVEGEADRFLLAVWPGELVLSVQGL